MSDTIFVLRRLMYRLAVPEYQLAPPEPGTGSA